MRDRRKKPLNAALPALLGAVLAAALLCGGCAGRSGEAEGSEASETSENSESSEVSELPEGPFTLPLPAVPAVITEPRDRADYIMEHFFDEMPFADRRLSLDTATVEQNMANFLSLTAEGSAEGLGKAASALADRWGEAGPEVTALWTATVEKYLYHPDSPMHSEDAFIAMARAITCSEAIAPELKMRTAHLLQLSLRNRPGERPADFRFTAPDGRTHTLRGALNPSGPTLLLLYDPDCPSCAETLAALRGMRALSQAVVAGRLKVVAVYPGEDAEAWRGHLPALDPAWTVGMASRELEEQELYDLYVMPVMHLIGEDGRISAKDIRLPQLQNLL